MESSNFINRINENTTQYTDEVEISAGKQYLYICGQMLSMLIGRENGKGF